MIQDNSVTTELRKCMDCRKEYEARKRNIMGIVILEGAGYCSECASKLLKEKEVFEQMVLTAEIVGKRRQWRDTCGIPARFMAEGFETFDQTRANVTGIKKTYEACVKYAKSFPFDEAYLNYPSLLIASDHSWGVGKTHLATSLCHEILNRWNGEPMACPVKFVSEPDLFQTIQGTYNYSPEEKYILPSETDIINQLVSVRLLVIDDVGKRRVQDPKFVQRVFFSVINGRYNSKRPIVMTSNLSPDKLRVYLAGGIGDESSYDRIYQMAEGKIYRLEGESYRRK